MEHQFASIDEQLRALDECNFDDQTTEMLRKALEDRTQTLRELEMQYAGADDIELVQVMAPALHRAVEQWKQFPPDILVALSNRVHLIATQADFFGQTPHLPPVMPMPLTQEQTRIFNSLLAAHQKERRSHQRIASFGMQQPAFRLVDDKTRLAEARLTFRQSLSAEQRAQWDRKTHAQLKKRRELDEAQAKAALRPIQIAQARDAVRVFLLEDYAQAADQAQLTAAERSSLMNIIDSLRAQLEALASSASQTATDFREISQKSAEILKSARPLAESAIGKPSTERWLSRLRILNLQIPAILVASRGVTTQVKKWLKQAGMSDALDQLLQCCRTAGTDHPVQDGATAYLWRLARSAREKFLNSLSAEQQKALEDATQVLIQ